jgi:hypothetical protein
MEAKISQGPEFTILYFHKAHSATDHVCEKDQSKYLKFQQNLKFQLWIGEALSKHKRGQCMDLFKVYIIGKQIMESDRAAFLTFANVWDLLNFWRAVATGFDVQLQGDVTAKASTAAFNKLGFGVNMLGSHFAPLSFSLIPAECESSQAYAEAYRALKAAVRLLIRINICYAPDCNTCRCIQLVREMPNVVAKTGDKTPYQSADKLLPIAAPMGDNSSAWQKFCDEVLKCPSNVCQTHATAIAANNGSHRQHFDAADNYDKFYEYVCRIMRCSFDTMGEGLQALLVEWLRSVNEVRAAEWFQTWWCGPVKGRWLLGHGGVGLTW